jgi:tRNA nucleotidyltransferase (CCA-adding enzyme)
MMHSHWEHFEHGADIGVRGFGPTEAAAFEQAALALIAVVADPDTVRAVDPVDFDCEAPDPELLLVHWLNAVISQMALHRMLFASFRVQIHGHRLKGHALGEAVSASRHGPAVEVKGATVTALRVARLPGGWVAQTVVDV